MAQQIASLFATVGADLTGLTSGLSQARGHLDGFAGQMASVGGNMQRIGLSLTAAVTTPIVGAGVASLKMAADFESATNILAIAARESGTPLEDLHDAALLVGKDTQLIGIDAMEAADAMTTFYKTGFTTSEVMGDLNTYLSEGTNLTGMLRAAIDLAAASDLDLARASDAVAIAIKTFGLNSEDATAVANSFVGAADASVAEVSDLTDAMYTFGPTANQYGWSLQDANTALAILSERGIRGSEAGTALRSMMTNMMRDTADTTAALDALNISLYDQNGQMRSLPDIVGQLSQAMSGLSEEERNAYIQTLAGTYGMKAMATLLDESTEGWEAMAEAIANSATAQEVGEQRTEGMNGALEQFEGAVQTLGITVGETFLPVATEMVEDVTNLADALAKLNPDMLSGVVKVLGGLALGGPILLGVGTLVKLLAGLPALLTVAAGAAALFAGVALFGSGKGKDFVDSLWQMDEAVFSYGGEEALQKWIKTRQGIAKAQGYTAIAARGPYQGEGEPDPWSATPVGRLLGAGFLGVESIVSSFPTAAESVQGITNEERAALDALVDMVMGPGTGRAYVVDNGEIKVILDTAPDADKFTSVLDAIVQGTAPNLEIANIAEQVDALIPPEGFALPLSFTLAQTPDEVAALTDSVLPPEGSLRRRVFLDVKPDQAQVRQSADEIAAVWSARVRGALERLKRNTMVESGGLDYLMGEARAQGMTP